MKTASLLVVLVTTQVHTAADPDPKKELDRLQGTWRLVEVNTKLAPDEVAM